ncbi:hypothetical protein CI238_00162 [Colletotrichum incanum]|uniref:Uncharacterized protein n=1 Tax=Colletotrichum incanum TaxID=1573173 RepID=A0A161Y9G0_COLIC|nr:hypothetical protein CI238_00162 [Colletotrichum incanum]
MRVPSVKRKRLLASGTVSAAPTPPEPRAPRPSASREPAWWREPPPRIGTPLEVVWDFWRDCRDDRYGRGVHHGRRRYVDAVRRRWWYKRLRRTPQRWRGHWPRTVILMMLMMLMMVVLVVLVIPPRSAVAVATAAPPRRPLFSSASPPLLPALPPLLPTLPLLFPPPGTALPPLLLAYRALLAFELAPFLRQGLELRLQRLFVGLARRSCGRRIALLRLLQCTTCGVRGADLIAQLCNIGFRDGLVRVREPRHHALFVDGELGGVEVLVVRQRADGGCGGRGGRGGCRGGCRD